MADEEIIIRVEKRLRKKRVFTDFDRWFEKETIDAQKRKKAIKMLTKELKKRGIRK